MGYRLELWDGQKLVSCWEEGEMMDLLFHRERGHALQDDLQAIIDGREDDKILERNFDKGTGLLGA